MQAVRYFGLVLLLAFGIPQGGLAESDASSADPLGSSDAVAVLDAVSGLVEVQRDGEWLEASEGDEVALDDVVRTGADSLARLRFLDDDPESGAEATLVDLGPDAEVQVEELEVRSDQGVPQRTGLLGVLRGAIHAITKGWSNGSMFSVRAGTTVCGIRGSIANVGYDPEDETTTITSLDGEMYTFSANSSDHAFRRTREAARHFGQGRRATFLRQLQVGEKGVGGRRGALRFARLRADVLDRARKAAHGSRRSGIHSARGWIGAFARVKPPAQRRAKLSRRRLERRVMLREGARRPQTLRNRIQDRLQRNDGGSSGDLGRKLRDRVPARKQLKRPNDTSNGKLRNLQKNRSLRDRMKRWNQLKKRRKGGLPSKGGLPGKGSLPKR